MLVLRRERFFAVCRRITYGFFPIKRAWLFTKYHLRISRAEVLIWVRFATFAVKVRRRETTWAILTVKPEERSKPTYRKFLTWKTAKKRKVTFAPDAWRKPREHNGFFRFVLKQNLRKYPRKIFRRILFSRCIFPWKKYPNAAVPPYRLCRRILFSRCFFSY